MRKQAYYFPHYSNARQDRKIRRIVKELGIEGYGIFFMLLEVLRDQSDLKYPLDDIDLLADEFGTSEPKVRAVVERYDLFAFDQEKRFFSPRLIVFLQPMLEKSQVGRISALKRWHPELVDRSENGSEMGTHRVPNANRTKQNRTEQNKTEQNNVLFECEKVWKLYPSERRVKKQYCLKKIENAIKEMGFSYIAQRVEEFAKLHKDRKTDPRFIQLSSTFFNQKTWAENYNALYPNQKGGAVDEFFAKRDKKN